MSCSCRCGRELLPTRARFVSSSATTHSSRLVTLPSLRDSIRVDLSKRCRDGTFNRMVSICLAVWCRSTVAQWHAIVAVPATSLSRSFVIILNVAAQVYRKTKDQSTVTQLSKRTTKKTKLPQPQY